MQFIQNFCIPDLSYIRPNASSTKPSYHNNLLHIKFEMFFGFQYEQFLCRNKQKIMKISLNLNEQKPFNHHRKEFFSLERAIEIAHS